MIVEFIDTYLEKVNMDKIEKEYVKALMACKKICSDGYVDEFNFSEMFQTRVSEVEALESGNIPSKLIAINKIYLDEVGLLWTIEELYRDNVINERRFKKMWKDACDVVLYAKHRILKDKAIEGWNTLHSYYEDLEDMYFAKWY